MQEFGFDLHATVLKGRFVVASWESFKFNSKTKTTKTKATHFELAIILLFETFLKCLQFLLFLKLTQVTTGP